MLFLELGLLGLRVGLDCILVKLDDTDETDETEGLNDFDDF